jgi:hypothetical protein
MYHIGGTSTLPQVRFKHKSTMVASIFVRRVCAFSTEISIVPARRASFLVEQEKRLKTMGTNQRESKPFIKTNGLSSNLQQHKLE